MEKEKNVRETDIARAKLMAMVGGVLASAALIAEIRIFMSEYKSEWILILGVGMIIIASVMLLIYSLMTLSQRNKELQQEEFDEILKAQKASYLMLRKNFEELSDRLYDM